MSIKKIIYNKISSIIIHVVENNKNKKIISLKRLNNVRIASDVVLGEFCDFNINGAFRLIEIESGFSCRKFCNFLLYPNSSIIIRKNVFFNNNCSVNCLGYIEIGEGTMFGEGVKIYDHNHKFYNESNKLVVEKNEFSIGRVVIGKNCWIGSNVTILNNVEIGDNSVIGANCLIYKSVPSNVIVKAQTNLIIENL